MLNLELHVRILLFIKGLLFVKISDLRSIIVSLPEMISCHFSSLPTLSIIFLIQTIVIKLNLLTIYSKHESIMNRTFKRQNCRIINNRKIIAGRFISRILLSNCIKIEYMIVFKLNTNNGKYWKNLGSHFSLVFYRFALPCLSYTTKPAIKFKFGHELDLSLYRVKSWIIFPYLNWQWVWKRRYWKALNYIYKSGIILT